MTSQPISDLLYGVRAIATYLGLSEKQCEHRIEAGVIPTFKMGGTVCALRSKLDTWLVDLSARVSVEGSDE